MSTLCETSALGDPICGRGRHFQRRKNRRKTVFACVLAGAVAAGLLGALLCARQSEALSALYRDPVSGAAHTISGVPYIAQQEEFPTGCESVSAVMLLNFYGLDVDAGEFIDNYLPLGETPHTDAGGRWVGCDPWEKFPGDPRTEQGWGCYAPVIERAMNACLSDTGLRAEYLSGKPLSRLCAEYIDKDIPVLIWATIEMERPSESTTWTVPATGRRITWVYPMHCLVLIGYDEDSYIFNDPWSGEAVRYAKESVENAYKAQHEQAVILK